MARNLYLKSYDLYAEILEYHLPDGTFAILPREKFTALGIPLAFGAFCREDRQVTGILASPEGPVFFMDSQHLVGRFGDTTATVKDVPGQTKRYFTLSHKQAPGQTVEFGLLYEQRLGLGANPYDNEEEDIDLLAMIASNIGDEAFFRAYTREWAGER